MEVGQNILKISVHYAVIVKKIAQLYNGSVGVESESGKGSTFTVMLKDYETNNGGDHE